MLTGVVYCYQIEQKGAVSLPLQPFVNRPRFGDVYVVRFEGEGSEQSGIRPAVVFQNNVGNAHSPNVTVFPMTSRLKKTNMPTHVVVHAADSGLSMDSMVLCENPVCISKEKLGKFITTLSEKYMAQIAEASVLASCGIAYIDPAALTEIWKRASEMNASVST